jgi:hypothetical protein
MSLTVAVPARAVIDDARRRQRRRRVATGAVLLGLALALVLVLRPWSRGPGSQGTAASVPVHHGERQAGATIPPVACVGPGYRIAMSPPTKVEYRSVVMQPIEAVLTQVVLHRLPDGKLAGLCVYRTTPRG